jgi:hypothetical protein
MDLSTPFGSVQLDRHLNIFFSESHAAFEEVISKICSSRVSEYIEDENYLNSMELEPELEVVEASSETHTSIDPLVAKINQLALDQEIESWELFQTQRLGYKLFSVGYSYTVDKPKFIQN